MTMIDSPTRLWKSLFSSSGVGSGGDRAVRADHGHAITALLGPETDVSVPTAPDNLTVVELVQFYLATGAFRHWVVNAAISGRDATLDVRLPTATLSWATRRLPLDEATCRRLTSGASQRDFLQAIFTDQTFLDRVWLTRRQSWSPSIFMPRYEASDDTVAFVDDLLQRQSPLLDSDRLTDWGLDRLIRAESLVRYGEVRGFRTNALFDSEWYAKAYDTGSTNYFENLRLYVTRGEGYLHDPNPFLNMRRYAEAHPDLIAESRAGRLDSILSHLISRDAGERRTVACHFDADHYQTQVPREAIRRAGSAFAHYVETGWALGLSPNPCFDPVWYLRENVDALEEVGSGRYPNAFAHFVHSGDAQGLSPCAFFDPKRYAAANADVAGGKNVNLFRHFWEHGRFEARDFGSDVTRAVATYFVKRFPDSLDRVTLAGTHRERGDPATVLKLARESSSTGSTSLVEAIDRPLGRDMKPHEQRAVRAALEKLGRPRLGVEVGLNQDIHAGDSTRFYVSGLAGFIHLPLRAVRPISNNVDGDCEFFRYLRPEESTSVAILGGSVDDLRSGFLAWFDFSADFTTPGLHRVGLEFVFGDPGDDVTLVVSDTVQVRVQPRPPITTSTAPVQVAMASYNPPLEPFRTQVDSILADPDVHLVISDDASPPSGALSLSAYAAHARVDISVNADNAGFISNFERSLYMCSPDADTILFADQDDDWQADKVATLRGALTDGVSCAFSDMRIVKADGEVISPTFWSGRREHHADPLTLGVANTVTGAAAAFPADLIDVLTPFPRYMGVYHDQWLAVAASAIGTIAYIERPLYDYIQHGANVLGFAGSRSGGEARWRYVARHLRQALRQRSADPQIMALAVQALGQTIPLLQRYVLWQEADLRIARWSDEDVHRLAIEVMAAIRDEPFDARYLRRAWGRLSRRAGFSDGLLDIDRIFESLLLARALLNRGVISLKMLVEQKGAENDRLRLHDARVRDPSSNTFEKKVAPIELASPQGPATHDDIRINLFLPELQLSTFFGGYHSKISLITRLVEKGIRTRLVLVDQPNVDYDNVARIIGAFPELEQGLARSEIVAVGARDRALDLGRDDVLLATTWWSAHIVDDLRRKLGRERFLYFIQEFEPFTFELGTWYRGAELTYDFPHDAIFSTEVLRDFFASIKAGVFGPMALPDARQMPFRNPITGLKGMPRVPLAERRPRLMFYARPQGHASRNMYDFGLSALRQAVQVLGDELAGWDIVGVGASENARVPLSDDVTLRLISKLDAVGYREMLASSDIGLGLMYTPHPSLVPLEMAAAGMITITNACMSKTQASFAGVSDLIHVAEPDVGAIATAIVEAVRAIQVGDVPHNGLDWPVTPEGAFPDAWLDTFADAARESARTTQTPAV